MVMLFVAFAGMAFKTETEASLRPGESASIKSPYGWTYRLTHLGISQYDALNRQVTAATLDVSRDGKRLGVLTTEKRQHVDALGRPTFQPSTEVGIRSDLREDLYVVLGGVVNGTEQAVFRFTINPLDRKSTHSSHLVISYAVFCLKKKRSFHAWCQLPADRSRA